MPRFLRPLTRWVTYTRWLHLLISVIVIGMWVLVFDEEKLYVPLLSLAFAGLIPAVRLVEGLQARLLLTGQGFKDSGSGISAAPSANWPDRWRTVLWLEIRLVLGNTLAYLTVHLPGLSIDLGLAAAGDDTRVTLLGLTESPWWYGLLAPLPIIALIAAAVGGGKLITVAALWLLGPSTAERVAALEERTEQLLERNRIAHELHDSIGHALTVAVLQAGAARAARNPEFTERALTAIEETGRAALEDLERVLVVLRESGQPASGRPTLADTDRLLASARASGAEVHAEVTGPVAALPGPVSREGYRIVQESLTNVLRHAGPVRTRIWINVTDQSLELEVRNPLDTSATVTTLAGGRAGGSGLRGIRERAALLGGQATTGPHQDEWRVRVDLPLDLAPTRRARAPR
ncbi:sensor histidine kinase [Streptomyces albipurpureus]|uniref:histidine kinase n=1 Tax=Streptomyces albipurpureus TaxID=2897419 RepID=A0ABT0UW02_9ACTN|nr:histidine kinase [Streptomyces sp. CWNU-1]MCM2392139.1 histidine kinase [Streptomyces sp. CWNU-1]